MFLWQKKWSNFNSPDFTVTAILICILSVQWENRTEVDKLKSITFCKEINVLNNLFQYYYTSVTVSFLTYHVEYRCTSHAQVTHKWANLHVQVNWTMLYCVNFNYFIRTNGYYWKTALPLKNTTCQRIINVPRTTNRKFRTKEANTWFTWLHSEILWSSVPPSATPHTYKEHQHSSRVISFWLSKLKRFANSA